MSPDFYDFLVPFGLEPHTVTTDAWYSRQKNMKFLKNKGLEFLTGIAKNRSCSVDGKNFTQVHNLEIPETGLIVDLKKFGQVKVFRRIFKNEIHRYYIMYVTDKDTLFLIGIEEFKKLHSIHWGIESSHRAIKQVCGIDRFMVSPVLQGDCEPEGLVVRHRFGVTKAIACNAD